MESYSELIKNGISKSGHSLSQITKLLKQMDVQVNRGYISKLQNSKSAPASDKVNDALAYVLKIDPIKLKAAAYREKIPPEVLKILQQDPQAQTA
ncbi:XRE family transcriptional regulator [Schinkia azotoformans]|uniref:XRE family transcriptional regulator n=1 Tax=Schinkia azotoformans TaxID=1454 RepID=UPI002E20801C|nr:XRE family transcriptional regulator [Schinkia azotoformans]